MKHYETQIRVRYAETDQMQIVYHANYFVWFEVGRTDFLRKIGYPYKQLEIEDIMFPVIECNCKFKIPAKYDDEIIIRTSLGELKGASMILNYEIIRKEDEVKLATGFTRHAIVNTKLKPIRLRNSNEKVWEKLQQYLG